VNGLGIPSRKVQNARESEGTMV